MQLTGLYSYMTWVAVGLFGFILFCQVYRKKWVSRYYGHAYLLVAFALFVWLLHLISAKFISWGTGELTRNLVPPYVPLGYFLNYALFRVFAPYFVSLVFSLLFLFTCYMLNRKYGSKFFEAEEPYLGALGLLLTGWPGSLIYLITILLLYLLIVLGFNVFKRNTAFGCQRMSLYYLWMPMAILVILSTEWLARFKVVSLLFFSRTF